MTNTLRFSLLAAALALASFSQAQWQDRKLVGSGGESCLSTDGKGNVYLVMHQPCRLFESHDYGASFDPKQEFSDGLCDMDVLAWGNGNVNVAYIKNGISGFASYYSTDSGRTLKEGSALSGSLDREWLAANPTNSELYFDFSNGYIGGPRSIGVFLAASNDNGRSFTQRTRIDKEPAGDSPVDPYLCTSSDGRIYAMWATSRDYDNIDRFDYAYSTDNGKTFTGYQNIATFHPSLGTTQERWILGCITSSGKDKVVAVYPDYESVTVDGKQYTPLLLHYRVSSDSGKTFSEPKLVTPADELNENIRNFQAKLKNDKNVGSYMQTLPWTCTDGHGRFHIAYQDNRDGQAQLNGDYFDQWHVRFADMNADGFGKSERVSDDAICIRPPLDFLSCAADDKRAYISWTESPGATNGWAFSGNTYFARKILSRGE